MHSIRIAAIGAAGMLAIAAPAALPHAGLVKTNPARGARVAKLPPIITLTFAEPLARAGAATVSHEGMNHATRTRLNPKNRRQVQIFTRGSMAAVFRVLWRVTAGDGHRETGSFRFTVTG